MDGGPPVPVAVDAKVRLGVRDGGERIQPNKSRRDELNALKDREKALRERLKLLEPSIDALVEWDAALEPFGRASCDPAFTPRKKESVEGI